MIHDPITPSVRLACATLYLDVSACTLPESHLYPTGPSAVGDESAAIPTFAQWELFIVPYIFPWGLTAVLIFV